MTLITGSFLTATPPQVIELVKELSLLLNNAARCVQSSPKSDVPLAAMRFQSRTVHLPVNRTLSTET